MILCITTLLSCSGSTLWNWSLALRLRRGVDPIRDVFGRVRAYTASVRIFIKTIICEYFRWMIDNALCCATNGYSWFFLLPRAFLQLVPNEINAQNQNVGRYGAVRTRWTRGRQALVYIWLPIAKVLLLVYELIMSSVTRDDIGENRGGGDWEGIANPVLSVAHPVFQRHAIPESWFTKNFMCCWHCGCIRFN